MPESPIPSTLRRRGGQRGNTNAFRHGGYARNSSRKFPIYISEVEKQNLLGEAARLKEFMLHIYNKNIESTDLTVITETLHALSLAARALSRVLEILSLVQVIDSNDLQDRLRVTFDSLDHAS